MGVYLDAIDHFCHGFMKFHPPQLEGLPDELFETYKEVVSSAYRFHDLNADTNCYLGFTPAALERGDRSTFNLYYWNTGTML